jgi:hypothetical protein
MKQVALLMMEATSFDGPHGFISQKMEILITTAVITSDSTHTDEHHLKKT